MQLPTSQMRMKGQSMISSPAGVAAPWPLGRGVFARYLLLGTAWVMSACAAPETACELMSPLSSSELTEGEPLILDLRTSGELGWTVIWSDGVGETLAVSTLDSGGNSLRQTVLPAAGEHVFSAKVDDGRRTRCVVETAVTVLPRVGVSLISPPHYATFSEDETISLQVAVEAAPSVVWTLGQEVLGEARVVDGVASLDVSLPVGEHVLRAEATEGEVSRALTLRLVVNGRPRLDGLDIEPSTPDVSAPLVARVLEGPTDPEDDALTMHWSWEVDGQLAPDLDTPVVPRERLARGQAWRVTAWADDGRQESARQERTVVIGNAPPALTSLEIGAEPTRATGATCTAAAVDPDGDPVEIAYAWLRDGQEIGVGASLPGASMTRGDVLSCEATPTDGTRVGVTLASPQVTVANAAPTALGARVTPASPSPGETLWCELVGVDDADGDAVETEHTWWVNGELSGSSPWLAQDLELGDEVRCVAVPGDGLESGGSYEATVVVTEPVGNVLLVVFDDLGVEKLESYGLNQDAAPTPTLDRLAEEGMSFSRVWSNPTCTPTRASLMTGRHTSRFGIGRAINPIGGTFPLDTAEIALPQALRITAPEVTSVLVGKWHLASYDLGAGADHPRASGFEHATGPFGNLRREMATDGGPMDYFDHETVVDGVVSRRSGYLTTHEAEEAIAWASTLPEPWFIMLSFHAPHLPFHTPPTTLTSTATPASSNRARYNLMIEAADTELERVLAVLDPQDTVIVVGDNGTPSNAVAAPLVGDRAKGSVYEGGIRVPLIVRGPRVSAPGSTCDALAHVQDLYPTVLDLLGGEIPSGLDVDGHSLAPCLDDAESAGTRSFVYSEYFEPNGYGPYTEHLQTVRGEHYKLLRQLGAPDELYALGLDYREGDDLLQSPLSPEAQAAYSELSALLASGDPDGP